MADPSARLIAAVLAVLFVLVAAACGGSDGADGSGAGVEITLRARGVAGGQVQDSDLDRAVAILEDRLEQAGVAASVALSPDSQRVVVRLDQAGPAAADRVAELSTRIGLLEFYDLEANLVPPSIDATGLPVATEALYDLLVGRQSPAQEDEVDSWYLFDSERKLAGGPSPTKRLLLPGGKLLDGWRTLGVPPGTAVLECGIGEIVCPGVFIESPRRDFYYLVKYDPPRTPELDGSDLQLDGTRQDFDTTTGEPIVVMQFTDEGAERFTEITRREAIRGKLLFNIAGGGGDPHNSFQHFAIVLDREIKSWPSIDWEQYPIGISGSNGVQITGIGDPQDAKDLATVLQTGALPVRFEVVAPSGG